MSLRDELLRAISEAARVYDHFSVGNRTSFDIVGAVTACGRRAIVSGGWAALGETLRSTDQVLIISSAAHSTIFPRMAAIVHHGGAGTTTAAARAGVPQVVLPHILDQYYWAHRVEALGLGPRPLPIDRVTTPAMALRLHELLDDRRFADRAREFGARAAARNGGAQAGAEYLESRVENRESSRR